MSTPEFKLIAAWVKDPSDSIFVKSKKSDHIECRTIECSCPTCPLLAVRKCDLIHSFGGSCPYGRYRTESGPTLRAAASGKFLRDRRERYKGVGWLSYPAEKLAFIGDYAYIPYAHANMCKAVPFLSHGSGFVSGKDFVPREHWTIENVLTLIDFRPQALFGGEIRDYQQKSVPLFISHIRELDSEMWRQLIAARPQYDTTPNFIGRKALVKTLASPIEIPPYDNRYPVAWRWDGEKLTTTSQHAYTSTWGHVKGKEFEMTMIPADDAAIEVKSNAWVTPETVFVD